MAWSGMIAYSIGLRAGAISVPVSIVRSLESPSSDQRRKFIMLLRSNHRTGAPFLAFYDLRLFFLDTL